MKIENWRQPPTEINNVVATFDLAFDFITISGLMLCRHRQRPADGFVRIPKAAYTGMRTCTFTHCGYSAMLRHAVSMHETMTGERLRTGWDKQTEEVGRAEADDAGLRRVLSAGEAEALEQAGI